MRSTDTDIANAARWAGLSKARGRAHSPITRFARAVWMAALTLSLAVLPLFLFTHVALQLSGSLGWDAWISTGIAALATSLLISVYLSTLWRWLTGRSGFVFLSTRIVAPASILFVIAATLFLAASNAKTPRVQSAFHDLHPTLRVAASSLLLIDDQVVLTDIRRTPEAYARMALPVARRSAHYLQADGFVHAIDVRTRGRGRLENLLTQTWFSALGFDTRRHTGSADHLHVSVPSP